MSDTATTPDTREALRRLASRFARLAESRIADQDGHPAKTGSWTLLLPMDRHVTTR